MLRALYLVDIFAVWLLSVVYLGCTANCVTVNGMLSESISVITENILNYNIDGNEYNEGYNENVISSYMPLAGDFTTVGGIDIPGHSSLFYTCITEDQLHYGHIFVPRGSPVSGLNNSVRVHAQLFSKFRVISASKVENQFHPVILIRKNAVPTTTNFDYSVEFESVVVLTDELVSDNDIILYFGIWGGLPNYHSRYFAGEPTVQCIEVESRITYEVHVNSSVVADGIDVDALGLIATALLQDALDESNQVRSVATNWRLSAPRGLLTEILIESPVCLSGGIIDNCTLNGAAIGTSVVDVVKDSDKVNTMRLVYTDIASSLNDGNVGISQGVSVRSWDSSVLVYPIVGFSVASDGGVVVKTNPTSPNSSSLPGGARLIGEYVLSCQGSSELTNTFLDSLLNYTVSKPKLQVTFFAPDWRLRGLSAQQYKDLGVPLSSGVKYRTSIPTSVLYSNVAIGVGGFVYVQYFTERKVKLLVPLALQGSMDCTEPTTAASCAIAGITTSSGNIRSLYNLSITGEIDLEMLKTSKNTTELNPSDYVLSLFVGGQYSGCGNITGADGTGTGIAEAECPSGYVSTDVSRSTALVDEGIVVSHGEADFQVVTVTELTKWTWLLEKPVVPTYHPYTGISGASSAYFYLQFTPVMNDAPYDPSDALENASVVMLEEVVMANRVSLSFVGCPVGAMLDHELNGDLLLCNKRHGVCQIQYGDVAVSTCVCKYPWEGSSCDDLSIPYSEYLLQIMVLVLSNLTMMPAVVLCLYRGLNSGLGPVVEKSGNVLDADRSSILLVVGTVLGLSATASMLYHLCDTDAVCVGGVSFEAWQIFDVLFSIVSMVAVILYYSPMSIEVRVDGMKCSRESDTILNDGYEMVMIGGAPDSEHDSDPVGAQETVISAGERTEMILGADAVGTHNVSVEDAILPGLLSAQQGSMCIVSLFLLVLGVVIVPVCNDPTNPMNVALGLACSFVLCFGYWCCYAVFVSSEVRRYGQARHDKGSAIASTQKRRSDKGVPSNSACEHDLCNLSSLEWNTDSRSTSAPRAVTYWSLWSTILGIVAAIFGMASFAFQSAEGYWLVHSIWHVCMMLSAYCLVYGRDSFVIFLKCACIRFLKHKEERA